MLPDRRAGHHIVLRVARGADRVLNGLQSMLSASLHRANDRPKGSSRPLAIGDHGCTGSASFCRTFEASYGVSPSAWRERAVDACSRE